MYKKYFFSLFIVTLSVCHVWGATLYYDDSGTGDEEWNNINNWWTDSISTIQAGSLPSISDDVVIKRFLSSNSGDPISVRSMTVNNGAHFSNITVTATNGITFHGNSYCLDTTITGDVTFNDSSSNGGDINGNVIFNDSSSNAGSGTISGDVTFNDSSSNGRDINGDVTFNDSTHNSGGIISGMATFNNVYGNESTVTDAVFNTGSGGNADAGVVTGTATFNGFTSNAGSTQNAIFNNYSTNDSYVLGNAIFNNFSVNNFDGGFVNGDATFNDGSHNDNGVYGNATFNNSSSNRYFVAGNATFNNNSYNDGTINGNADVYSPSQNPISGTVLGTVTYHGYTPVSLSISSISYGYVTPNPSVEIYWSTNLASTSRVEYGVTESYGNFSALYMSLTTDHRITLESLVGNTTYHYRVISIDADGHSSTSGDNVFTTRPYEGGPSLTNQASGIPSETQENKKSNGPIGQATPEENKDNSQSNISKPSNIEESGMEDNKNHGQSGLNNESLSFKPFATREKTLKIALKLAGIDITGTYLCQNKFTDALNAPTCEIAEKSQLIGLTSEERTTFRPERFVTRAEAYAIFMNSACIVENETNQDNWQTNIINQAISLGFTSKNLETFGPNKPISTGEMFALAQRIGEWKTQHPNSCKNI